MTRTNFCHIFPPFATQNLKPEQLGHAEVCSCCLYALIYNSLTLGIVQTHYAGTVWDTVLDYGQINVLDELDGSDGHRLSNGLTLNTRIHYEFDRLDLWFEEIPVSGIDL